MKTRDVSMVIFIGALLIAVIVMCAAGVQSCTNGPFVSC